LIGIANRRQSSVSASAYNWKCRARGAEAATPPKQNATYPQALLVIFAGESGTSSPQPLIEHGFAQPPKIYSV
jgi:hypothetical protein